LYHTKLISLENARRVQDDFILAYTILRISLYMFTEL